MFHLDDLGGDLAAALPELAVGPWHHTPAGLVAFDAGGPATPRWRVELVRDGAVSHRALAGGERSVADTHALLDDMPGRLADAIDRALAARSRAVEPPTRESPAWGRFASSTDPGAALTSERTAGDNRPTARTRESTVAPTWGRLAPSGAVGASLAPVRAAEARLIAALTGGTAPLELDQLAWSTSSAVEPAEPDPGRLGTLLERVADLARGRSRIETRIEGALVARSITTLTGDTELWIAPRLSVSDARLHARSVAVAVRTRHAWTRVLTMTVRGAGRLAVLGLPGGVVAAVPVVWRFVRDVLRELRRRDAALRQTV